MIVEIEEESRDFVTIYKRDYLGKKTKRTIQHKPLLNYPPPLNILNGPYKRYLNTRWENRSLPENERSEDPVDNLNRIRNKFPHLRNALPHIVPDETVIEHDKANSKKTVYQLDYWKEFDYVRRDIALPHDWVIPETIQRRAYRNPWLIATKDLLKPQKMFQPCNNLDPNLKEREILRISTGNSEYIDTIGATGERIAIQSFLDTRKCSESQKPIKSPKLSEP